MKLRMINFINYGLIYYFGLVFGALPFKYNYPESSSSNSNENGPAFTTSTTGRAFCYTFFLINLYSLIFVVQSTLNAIAKYDSCFDEFCSINVCRTICAHFIIVWINYVANFASSLTLLFVRREKTLKCLNGVSDLLDRLLSVQTVKPFAWIVVFFIILQIYAFLINWKIAEFELEFVSDYLPLYVAQCLPLVTENIICVMLLITQNCYEDVNRRIKRMIDRQFYSVDDAEDVRGTLQLLKYNYWMASDVSNDISNCFGVDFFVAAFCTTIRYIYYLFLNLKYITSQSHVVRKGGGLVLPGYPVIMFSMAVVGKFYYLCYRCDNVVSKAKETISNLYTLLDKLHSALDEKNEEIVEEFLNLVKCREVSFSACYLFTLNRRLICTVFGLMLSYFIVLLQFQAHAS